ncbi:MAG: hypothetical protein GY821_08040, partial [Gammaproteobacteria bacterium]|nr:hypothetical protein [Gammaproteobacteria bacterium]
VIIGSLLTGNTRGIYMYRNNAAPTITDSTITANSYGVYLSNSAYGSQATNPDPVITGSGIYANTTDNYYTDTYISAVNTVLTATGNWWGSTDPAVIASGIRDYTDTTSSPVVDFSGYLDGPGGASASSATGLSGLVSGTLPAGQYEVLSSMTIPAGETLILEAGAELSFIVGSVPLRVSGTLTITGSEVSPVIFSSPQATPAKGDWAGIKVQSGGVLNMDNAVVEYATNGIQFLNGSSGTVSNSELRNNTNGITFSGNSNGTVSNSELRNNTYGLYFPAYSSASPVIIGSLLTGNTRGIYMYRNNAAPTITDSTITANSYGVYLSNSAYGSQ